MERILKRHHPNSISALILTANSESTDSTSGQTPRVKFLENRVQQLEQELSKTETESQTKIQEIQNKLQEMKVWFISLPLKSGIEITFVISNLTYFESYFF